MHPEPDKNAEETAQDYHDYNHIPYNGFVNVNDIVKKRRQLRNAEFNVSDDSWDADLNARPAEKPE